MPAAPCVTFLGFAFNQTINSFKSCAGVVFFATISCGLLANKAMGSKSFTTSYCRSGVLIAISACTIYVF